MRLTVLLILLGISCSMQAQTVTGNWYGLAEAVAQGSNTNNYLTEFVIKQKGNKVEGTFSYYFRSSFQSYYIKGVYDAATRKLVIKNLPVAYFKNRDVDGIDCPMDFEATLFTSKVKSTLSGSFKSHEKYKYTCPELSFSCTLDTDEKNQDSLIHSFTSNIKKYWKPREEDLVVNPRELSAGITAQPAATKPDSAVSKPIVTEIANDSAVALESAAVKTATIDSVKTAAAPVFSADSLAAVAARRAEEERVKDIAKLIASFEKRKTVRNTEVEIQSDSIRISFYDNGVIDGDSITIFVNKYPVLAHQPLAEKALNMYMAMANVQDDTEISMFAENLGKYPPNTALMVITDGNKRKEIFLSSSLSQNASVILKKRKQ